MTTDRLEQSLTEERYQAEDRLNRVLLIGISKIAGIDSSGDVELEKMAASADRDINKALKNLDKEKEKREDNRKDGQIVTMNNVNLGLAMLATFCYIVAKVFGSGLHIRIPGLGVTYDTESQDVR